MANCGIEKYDNLDARIGFIDIDYLRYRLNRNLCEHGEITKKLDTFCVLNVQGGEA